MILKPASCCLGEGGEVLTEGAGVAAVCRCGMRGADEDNDCDNGRRDREQCDGCEWNKEDQVDWLAQNAEAAAGCQLHGFAQCVFRRPRPCVTLDGNNCKEENGVAGDDQRCVIDVVNQAGGHGKNDTQGQAGSKNPCGHANALGNGKALGKRFAGCRVVVGGRIETCHGASVSVWNNRGDLPEAGAILLPCAKTGVFSIAKMLILLD